MFIGILIQNHIESVHWDFQRMSIKHLSYFCLRWIAFIGCFDFNYVKNTHMGFLIISADVFVQRLNGEIIFVQLNTMKLFRLLV